MLTVDHELACAHSAPKRMFRRLVLPHIVSEKLLVARNYIFQKKVRPSRLQYPCDRSEY